MFWGLHEPAHTTAVTAGRLLWVMTRKAQVEHISSAPARESGRYRGLAAAPCGAPDWRGLPNVRLPYPKAAFGPQGRFSQLSAINRHNRQLFDDLVGAQHDRWGYGKTERFGGLEVHGHLKFRR